MKVLIAGANGKVGTILSGKLWGASGFSPVGLIRDNRQQMKFTGLGVPSVLGDLEQRSLFLFTWTWTRLFLQPALVVTLGLRKQRMSIRMPLLN